MNQRVTVRYLYPNKARVRIGPTLNMQLQMYCYRMNKVRLEESMFHIQLKLTHVVI